jgi:hypothetical protein
MAAEIGIPIVAVAPACTSRWGAQHWHKPLTSKNSKPTRHHAAAVAIGRRALGHPGPAGGTSQALEVLGEDGTAPARPE